ncbi:MAG: hypothetical protein FJ317_09000, partial [SAR202 cluster bacterium]|nr:hypothetical protein [SAR202 cluster bacterium]
PEGDYFTSPKAHPAFGACIALFLLRAWHLLGKPSPFWVVEMGAGDGQLGRDIRGYLDSLDMRHRPVVRYVSLDRALSRSFPGVTDSESERLLASGIPLRNVVGCFLSNELLDAFPVHRFQAKGGKAQEIYVTLDESSGFAETLDRPSSPSLEAEADAIASRLPDGARWEINPSVGSWAGQVSSALDRGFVLTIDYGDLAPNLHRPERAGGTLATYYRHVPAGSPYQRIGRQDITAHVDFTRVASEGDRHGLRTLGMTTQRDFLEQFGLREFIERARTAAMPAPERQANLMAMRELAKPGGLGDFKVLVQEKESGVATIETVFAPGPPPGGPLPLLSPEHMQLLSGRYPQADWQPETFGLAGEDT